MSVLDLLTRMLRPGRLMDEMTNKLDIAQQMATLPDHAAVRERASARCADCTHTDACRHWLTHEPSPASAPDFCGNHDLFERVLARVELTARPD